MCACVCLSLCVCREVERAKDKVCQGIVNFAAQSDPGSPCRKVSVLCRALSRVPKAVETPEATLSSLSSNHSKSNVPVWAEARARPQLFPSAEVGNPVCTLSPRTHTINLFS